MLEQDDPAVTTAAPGNDINPGTEPALFNDPDWTAKGEARAWVKPKALKTLWFNTGTLCNLACANCYIESTPSNDALVYLSAAEVAEYLAEIRTLKLATEEIGFTGGEPFMNPQFMTMLEHALASGFRVLLLTNAMRPMEKCAAALLKLGKTYGAALEVRVSLDHYRPEKHEAERGVRSWAPALKGLKWLSDNGFHVSAAARGEFGSSEREMREGFRSLFEREQINIDADDPARLVIFPEMDDSTPVPEISTRCWGLLNVNPDDMMCATSRMVVKRKGDPRPLVAACTLLPYQADFEMGRSLAEALKPVKLNHRHCAKFCVLGGGACSAG